MTKAGIMQPYFFPYLGYFGLIKHTDKFILFDTVQFIRHGWIERNRILKQQDGWLYVKVALEKAHRHNLIKDTYIDNNKAWQDIIRAQLQHYKAKSPYYQSVMDLVVEPILSGHFQDISHLNKAALEAVCNYLAIDNEITLLSEMGLSIDEAKSPDEWALNICRALGINEYLNPPGGKDFFDRSKYEQAGINLKFYEQSLFPYDQRRNDFISGLSILDVMMFNDPKEVNLMLENYELT